MHKTYNICDLYHILIMNIWYNNIRKDTILFYVQGLKKGVQNETLSL